MFDDRKNYLNKLFCSGCGICTFVCKEQAVTLVKDVKGFTPLINESRCNQCGLCLESCPVIRSLLSQSFMLKNKNEYTISELIGSCQDSYAGYCLDDKLRKRSTSGGIVTATLIYLLKRGLIDGAVVAVQNSSFKNAADLFISRIARTEKEILEAQGSKYIQLSMENALEEIRQDKTLRRISLVGTGCQIRAVKLNIEKIPELQGRTFYYLGLFCKQNKIPEFTNYLLSIVRQNYKKIYGLRYRGNGYPGWLSIDEESKLSFKDWKYGFLPWYVNAYGCYACLTCGDCTAEEADISCGDAWLPQYEEKADNYGYSVFLTRSPFGEGIIKKMFEEKIVAIEKINPVLIAESQLTEKIIIKKARSSLYGWLFNKKARITALKDLYLDRKPSFLDTIGALNYLFWSQIFASNIFRKAIIHIERFANLSFRLAIKIIKVFDRAGLGSHEINKAGGKGDATKRVKNENINY